MIVSILLAPSNVGAEAGAAVREKIGVNKGKIKMLISDALRGGGQNCLAQ